MNRFLNALHLNGFKFATKKVLDNRLKVSVSKISEQLKGQLIYHSSIEKQFKIGSLIAVAGLTFSILIFRSHPAFVNLIPTLITLSAVFYYQRRIVKTVKQIIVQKTGEYIMLKTYGVFGTHFFSKSTKIPIQIMSGVRRKKINKAIVIEGGGKYDIKKFSYYFHEKGVVDKHVFDNVVGGKSVHYVDRL